ncbi:hypothetical protein [Streptomyces pactum]|uniref:Uncharacterized protein n=1 Tax=Streptomyces pactum TaxID=68249 RepID=A0A1S6JGK8_9ACTN|nr:hypothetical protein [Streptomyces pactum]AQS70890.1 hypothetical protein B1H29_31930 [Streptomyces pactum]
MSAPSTVAAALASLLDTAPSWLPQVDHWEIAEDTDTWILSGQLAGDPREAEAFRLLAPVMERATTPHSDDGRLVKVPFEWDGVTGQVWYLRPVERYVVPERCASCPTLLADAGNQFVRLGGRGAPVICVPCRDRMHEAWVREAAVRELGALPMPVGPEPQEFREDGVYPQGTAQRVQQRALAFEYLASAKPASTELVAGLAKTVRDVRDHQHPAWEDLYCLNLLSYMGERMGPVLRRLLDAEARVAELEAAPRTVYRASHDSIPMGLYRTAAEARKHCETELLRKYPETAKVEHWWSEDEDTVDQPEDGEAELFAHVTPRGMEPGRTWLTGYVVTPLEVASEYDAEADE